MIKLIIALLTLSAAAAAVERVAITDANANYSVRPDQVKVPVCRDDQYLVADSIGFRCATFATCLANHVLTFTNNSFSCIYVMTP